MFNWYIIIAIVLSLALIGLGTVVMLRNSKLPLNRRFLLFTFSIAVWLVTNFISNDPHIAHNVLLISNRILLVAGGMVILSVLSFILCLAGWKPRSLLWYSFLTVVLISWGLSLSPWVIKNIVIAGVVTKNEFGPLEYFYFVPLFLAAGITLTTLVMGHFKLSKPVKTQLDIITMSAVITLPSLLITNALLPIFGYYALVNVSSLFIFFVVFAVSYSIVKNRLFDLRLIILRSLGYVVTLAVISGFYGLVSYYIAKLATHVNNQIFSVLFNVALIVLIVSIFLPLKKSFNKITNKIFYRDAYDTQVFLDEFNKILVTTYELRSLLRKSAEIVEKNLKPVYTVFGIKETMYTPRRITGTAGHPVFSESDIAFVRSLTPKLKRKMIIVDELEGKNVELQEVLRSNNITIISRLASSVSEEGVGYLILGPKKSGNLYNSQDLKVIEIITNELVVAIQNALHTEEIENFNLTLQAKVDDATRRLRGANKRLVQLDSTKDDFISMASHQLRTPLTSVKGYLSLVLDGDAGSVKPSQRKLLAQAFTSSQRMAYLIADLLNVSRLKTGKFLIQATPVNLADVIEDEIQQLLETIKEKGLTLKYDKPTNFPVIQLDDTKTRQVIMNFIDNAVYYTHAGGQIDIVLSETPKAVELRVIDNGIGVPRAEQYHLFSKFYRAKNAQKARPDGTGLGLFMAKKVIIAQGGSVIFNSKEDHGSTFGFSFAKDRPIPEQA